MIYNFWSSTTGDVAFGAPQVAALLASNPQAGTFTGLALSGDVFNNETIASATPASERLIWSQAVLSAPTINNVGNTSAVTGVMGEVDINGVVTGGNFFGIRGKIVVGSVLNSGTGNVAPIFGELNLAAATLTAGSAALIWGDCGTVGPSATAANFALMRLTNSTSVTSEAVLQVDGRSQNLVDVTSRSSSMFAAAGTGAGSAGNSTHCAAQFVLQVKCNGTVMYIPTFNQNT